MFPTYFGPYKQNSKAFVEYPITILVPEIQPLIVLLKTMKYRVSQNERHRNFEGHPVQQKLNVVINLLHLKIDIVMFQLLKSLHIE